MGPLEMNSKMVVVVVGPLLNAEQAKAKFDPRVGPLVAPRVGPRVAPQVPPRERPREHPRGLISLFSGPRGLPTKYPTRVSTEGPTSGRSGLTCPVFTCSVL